MNPRCVVINSIRNAGNPSRLFEGRMALMMGEEKARSVNEHEELRKLLEQDPLKLNLWPRYVMLEGYINVGVSSDCDVVADVRDMHWVDTDSVDEIRAMNAVQHFYRDDTLRVFEEWLRILKPGGALYIEMPDIREFAKKVAAADDMALFDCQPPLVWGIDGSQMSNDEKNETNRNALTKSRCKFLLKMAGFAEVTEEKPEEPEFFCPFRLKAVKGGKLDEGSK